MSVRTLLLPGALVIGIAIGFVIGVGHVPITSGHVLFIPGVLMIGTFLGVVLGARAARNQLALQQKRDAEREAARAARAAKKAAAGGGESKSSDA